MTNRITAHFAPRFAVLVALAAATLTGTLVTPAFADNDDWNNGWNQSRQQQSRQQQWRQQQWRQEQAREAQARQRAAQQERWREAHRYNRYYRQPDVYYTAPPVVYQPPGYYQQSGPSLNLNFPLH
jgi:Ni/Co efflux regulator RcnB